MIKNRNIVFIGFMGSGKSMVSKELSRFLGRDVYSTDHLIEMREGMPIKKIFDKKGEKYFRQIESEIVEEVASKEDVIIDCGGGVVLNPSNMKHLKEKGIVIYLKTTAESALSQVKNSTKRPLLNVVDPLSTIKQLMDERAPLYEQADYILDVANLSLDDLTNKVKDLLNNVGN